MSQKTLRIVAPIELFDEAYTISQKFMGTPMGSIFLEKVKGSTFTVSGTRNGISVRHTPNVR